MFAFLWYCFDDWLARVTETPWVGDVPFLVVLIVAIILCGCSNSTGAA